MKIAIAGAGVMGSGIAMNSILAGYPTILFDINETAVEKGRNYIETELTKSVEKGRYTNEQMMQALELLTISHRREEIIADFIIEAVIERLDIKQELFSALEAINSLSTIFATNTSSIPITQIAGGMKRPENVVGVHFFNPAHIMKLVEVISGVATSESVAEKASQWAKSLGKTVVFAKDAPGFIVNRVARHYYVEGLKLAEETVADFETIDRLCESSGFKMGPFRLMDLIGVETNYSVTSSMYEQFNFDPKFRPNRIQKQKVNAGQFGRKSGKGFYNYEK